MAEPRTDEQMRADARARYARLAETRCAFGNCVILYDPVTRTPQGGFGPFGCAHEHLAGGNARHPEGLPKPRFAVKAVGRNRGRIERSIRRHAGVGPLGLMVWAGRTDAGGLR